MSTKNRNHSFSLQPKASEIINMVKDQKKSGFVSDAIVEKYELDAARARSEQIVDQIPGPGEIADDEAKKVPQSRGGRGIFHFLRSFWL